MPDVIFDSGFKSGVMSEMDGGQTADINFTTTGLVRIGIYTAGNGLVHLATPKTMQQMDGATTGRLWWGGSVAPTLTVNPSGAAGGFQMSTGYQPASLTGTAAEFVIWTAYSAGSNDSKMIGGTVSGPGGGGDLVIADTNIVAGGSYRVQNFIVKIFESFSY